VAHARAKLTVLGRQLLVDRVVVDGWKPTDAAKAMGVSRQTAYKWLRRFRDEGSAGLADRSSAPKRCPHRLSSEEIATIVSTRLKTLHGPHRLAYALARHRSTIYGVLRREGISRLGVIDRPTRTVVRYERERPGELLHVDVKKLGKIREGGGWKMLGRGVNRPGDVNTRRVGFDYLHVAIDDHSRVAFVRSLPDEKGPTCAQFVTDASTFFAGHGVTIERVMTDNACNYRTSKVFQETLRALGITHKRTANYRPQTNGKAERFNRTMLEEFAYKELFTSNAARSTTLGPWVDSYNADRPHTAIGGLTPLQLKDTKTPIRSLDWHFTSTFSHHPPWPSLSSTSACAGSSVLSGPHVGPSPTRTSRSCCSGTGCASSNASSTLACGIDRRTGPSLPRSAVCSLDPGGGRSWSPPRPCCDGTGKRPSTSGGDGEHNEALAGRQ
jgi:transposase InsO family protein